MPLVFGFKSLWFAHIYKTWVTDFYLALRLFVPVHFLKRPANRKLSPTQYAPPAWPYFNDWELRVWCYKTQSGPELFPGGLDADSDVVPAVRCQQERGVKLSAWMLDGVCEWKRKNRQYLCVWAPMSVHGLSHTRLMATVEVFKCKL